MNYEAILSTPGPILWTVLPYSPPVVQYYHTNISDLYWSGTWYKRRNECLNLWLPQTDAANCPNFNIVTTGHCKEKQCNKNKVRCPKHNVRLLGYSTQNSCLSLTWHWKRHNRNHISSYHCHYLNNILWTAVSWNNKVKRMQILQKDKWDM
jgi:hypothetical protein